MPGIFTRCGLAAACWLRDGFNLGKRRRGGPHLRWSQAPPLPWPRPGSADIYLQQKQHKKKKTQQESPFAAALKVTASLQVAASVAASLSVAAAALEVAAASVPQPKESQAKGRNRMEV